MRVAENWRGDGRKKNIGMRGRKVKGIKDKEEKQRQAWERRERTSKIRESNKTRKEQGAKQ